MDLPEGTKYDVTETRIDGYSVTKGGDDYNGSIIAMKTQEAPYINKRYTPEAPKTDDAGRRGLYMLLNVVSAIGIAGIMLYRKKRG